MENFDLVIKDGTVLVNHPQNASIILEQSLDIGIQNGLIKKIGLIESKKAKKIFSAKNLHVLPGLMDCQVHFREPGMEHKEDFETGSRSALLGGITAVFEMPNTFPPTTTLEALEDKKKKAHHRFYCDYAFFLGASPENVHDLHKWENQKGCCGVKIFMGSSTGSLLVDRDQDLETIIKNSTRRMAVHSEDEKRLIDRKSLIQQNKVASHTVWRDEQTALISTRKLVKFADQYQKPLHILHVTTAEEIELLSKYKELISVEVTPQHLTLCSPDCYNQSGSLVQMNPPIRGPRHQRALWQGVWDHVVDIIGSDHAPHTFDEKSKPYPQSPSGMPGVQTLLPLLLYHRQNEKLDLKNIVRLLALNPYKKFKIKKRGQIAQDFIANFTILDLKKEKTITKDWLAYKCGWSPFEGMRIKGWPTSVILRGQVAMQDEEILSKPLGEEIHFE